MEGFHFLGASEGSLTTTDGDGGISEAMGEAVRMYTLQSRFDVACYRHAKVVDGEADSSRGSIDVRRLNLPQSAFGMRASFVSPSQFVHSYNESYFFHGCGRLLGELL